MTETKSEMDKVFDEVGDLERFPKLEIDEVGQSKTIRFLNDGRSVSKEDIDRSLKEKGVKGVKARDSLVFIVACDENKFELWISRTNYSNLNQIKAIRKENNNTLTDAVVVVKREAKNDPTQASYSFNKA